MNYNRHYSRLIQRARNRTLYSYVESHHIIPLCMNGSDDIENLVDLTPEEHYVAHQLLVKMYPGNYLLVRAMKMMTIGNQRNNKEYGWVARKNQEMLKSDHNPAKRPEVRAKLSKLAMGHTRTKGMKYKKHSNPPLKQKNIREK